MTSFIIWMLVGMFVAMIHAQKNKIPTNNPSSIGGTIGNIYGFLFVSVIWPITLYKLFK